MNFVALYFGFVALSAVLATGVCSRRPQTLMQKIAEHRLRRQAQSVWLWQPKESEECEKRWKSLTVTACGVNHVERVPTCEGMCNSETGYQELPNGSIQTVRKCRCCFIKDGSIDWVEKTYPGCAASVSVPRDLECECNKCLRDTEIRDGAPFSSA